MRIGRIQNQGEIQTVIFLDDGAYPLSSLLGRDEEYITSHFYEVIEEEESILSAIRGTDPVPGPFSYALPIPCINQIRDFYAFEEHVKAGRKSRGLDMIPEWYEIPVFYYTGTSSLYPAGNEVKYPSYSDQLDFELEVAIVVGKAGINIHSDQAAGYISGMMLMNDWSARDEQRKEMKLNLGPAKGKDFGTSLGPYILTGSELSERCGTKGEYDIPVEGYVNGERYSSANVKTMHWTFGDMIERASRDVYIRPGDIIMSGTVGTGCILELGPERLGWLKRGDEVEFRSPYLGVLRNRLI